MHGRHMGTYTHGQTAYVNTNKNRTEVVIEHAHSDRNTCNTPTRFVVQREIVGSGMMIVLRHGYGCHRVYIVLRHGHSQGHCCGHRVHSVLRHGHGPAQGLGGHGHGNFI